MKKRIFVAIILIILFTTINIALSFSSKSDDTEQGSEIAIMVQNENNNTQYDKWGNETWPDENQYQLNTAKSNCNGSDNVTNILSYSNKNIILTTNQNYRCNLYFDKKNDEPLIIESVIVDNNTPETVKLTVQAKGGDGNYTYDVERTCTDFCGIPASYCGKNIEKNISGNEITITGLSHCVNHNFKVIVKDGSNHESSSDQKDIKVEEKRLEGSSKTPCSICSPPAKG